MRDGCLAMTFEESAAGGVPCGPERRTAVVMTNAEAAVKSLPLSGATTRYGTGVGHNSSNVEDPWYDAKIKEASEASTMEELNSLVKELDQYAIEQFWTIFGPVAPQFMAVQPWVIGFNAEPSLGDGRYNSVFTRLWIDQDLKQEMGF